MENVQTKKSLDFSQVNVVRDVYKSKQEPLPVSDLSGKGILDGSNNRSKMNSQHN